MVPATYGPQRIKLCGRKSTKDPVTIEIRDSEKRGFSKRQGS